MSAKFSPAACTRINTSPARGCGSGFSWTFITSMPPVPVVTICRTVCIISVLLCGETYPPTTVLVLVLLLVTACNKQNSKQLTLAVVEGVEGEALKQAALDYEKQTGVHVNIAQFPYANLFEKELVDFNARTGAYDLVMMDDPWFPRFAGSQLLIDLTPLLQKRGQSGPDADFVATSVAVCRHPYQTGALFALPYVGN